MPAKLRKIYHPSSDDHSAILIGELHQSCLSLKFSDARMVQLIWNSPTQSKAGPEKSGFELQEFAKIPASTRIASVMRGPYHDTRVPSIK